MRFITLGSSSSGNGYLLRSSTGETLLLEAGVKLTSVKKVLDFDLSGITGLLVSHLHNDHSGHLPDFQKAGIQCYMNAQTAANKFGEKLPLNVHVLKAKQDHVIGSFTVKPISLKHDVENFGYLIHHPECGLLTFITDTHYCPYVFPGLNNILVELNYSDEILNKNLNAGKTPMFVRNRIIKSHMEMQTTIDFLKANDLSKVNNIVLLHLSDANSNAQQFKKTIQEVTGKQVFVAEPNLDISLNVTPF